VAIASARRRLTPIGTAVAVGLLALVMNGCGQDDATARSRGAATLRGGTATAHGDGMKLDLGVVAVLARIGDREVRSSGTVVDGDRGLVLTSAHSVWGASSLKLGTGVAVLHGRIVARSPCDDLALVETQPWVPGMVALPQAHGPVEPGALTTVARRWDDGGGGIVSTAAQAAAGRRRPPAPLLAAIMGGVGLRGALAPEASGGPVLDAAGRVVAITDVVSGRAAAVPIGLVKKRMHDLRPGPGTQFVGWSEYYRCAPLQQAYAEASYPGFRRQDARLNAPVPATRLPGTASLDR
jgi:S1-C subfamily serine protease